MKYRIFIGTDELEVDDISYPIDLAVFDLDNPDTYRSNKSKIIKVPATAVNQGIIGRLEDTNITRTITGVEGRLEYGNFRLEGVVRFYDTEVDNGHVVYQFQIISGNGDWVKQIEDAMLTELVMDSIEHEYTEANIVDSETNGGDYLYPLVNYGVFEGTDGESVLIEDRLPAVKIYAILQKIFNTLGYKIVSDFISNASGETFINWFMSFGRNPEIHDQEYVDTKLFLAGLSVISTGTQTVVGGSGVVNIVLWDPDNFTTVPFDEDDEDPNFDTDNNFNTTTYTYTAPEDGAYRFFTSVKVTIRFNPPLKDVDPVVQVQIIKNGVDVLVTESDSSYVWDLHKLEQEITVKADTRYVDLLTGDDITVKLTVTGTVNNPSALDDGDLEIDIETDSYFKNKVLRRPTRGYNWTVETMLPDITQLFFLKAVAHVFALQFTTNTRERIVYIEQFDDFYDGTVQSWANRLDSLQKILVQGKDIPTFINYRLKIDPADSMIVNYNTEVKFTNGNGDTVDSENGVFADTLLDYCREIGLITTKIPKLWNKKDEAPDIPDQCVIFLPRLFYYDGQTALPSGESWTFEDTELFTYPKIDIENFADWVDYRAGMHKLMNNSQSIQAYFNLSEVDINNLAHAITGKDFRSAVYLNDPLFRGRWLIKKITGWIPEKTTLVEMIQARRLAGGVTDRQVEILNDGRSGGSSTSTTTTTTTTGASCLITDSAIIAEITDDANWSGGNFTGSEAGLEECNYYIDWTNKIKYFYDGTYLVRFNINTVI